MSRPGSLPALLLILLFASEVCCAEDRVRPNIVLLVSDDQRPDTIHALGNSLIRTPHLDRLVAEGCAFTRSTCSNPICTPSRAEILTGCSSLRNGVHDFGGRILPDIPLMPRWFADAGYTTWYVGKWHNDGLPTQRGYTRTNGLYMGGGARWMQDRTDWAGRPMTGYRGWLFRTDEGELLPDLGVGLTADISARFADAAIELIESAGDEPFFLHVNFTAPHDPLLMPPGDEFAYDPAKMPLPENFLAEHPFDHGNFDGRDEKLFQWPRTPEETKGELAVYYSVISHMDQQVGRIVETLRAANLLGNTIIVYASDHGLGVGSHGLRGKQSMYEHTIGVPLILRGPGIPAGEQRAAQCYLRDLFPTLCSLTGVPGPGGTVDGISLLPVIDGSTREVHSFVVGTFRNSQRMIRTPEWKYIEYPEVRRQQLFHLTADPLELQDLSADEAQADTRTHLAADLHAWLKEHGDPLETGGR